MKIKPVARIALARQPSPLFAEGIEIDQEKEEHAEHTELHANGAARLETDRTWGKGAIGGAEGVVVKAIAGDDENDGKGEHPRKEHAELVPALGVLTG